MCAYVYINIKLSTSINLNIHNIERQVKITIHTKYECKSVYESLHTNKQFFYTCIHIQTNTYVEYKCIYIYICIYIYM